MPRMATLATIAAAVTTSAIAGFVALGGLSDSADPVPAPAVVATATPTTTFAPGHTPTAAPTDIPQPVDTEVIVNTVDAPADAPADAAVPVEKTTDPTPAPIATDAPDPTTTRAKPTIGCANGAEPTIKPDGSVYCPPIP